MSEPYLSIGGREVANGVRTLTYLRRFMPQDQLTVALSEGPFAPGSGYVDSFDDVYFADQFDARDLACWCEDLLEPNTFFAGPADDPAPWHDPDIPDSENFFGLFPTKIDPQIPFDRIVSDRIVGGSSIGPVRRKGVTIKVEGLMFGLDRSAIEYGRSWLRQALLTRGVPNEELSYLPACGGAFKNAGRIGVTDGPLYETMVDDGDCIIEKASFTVTATEPFFAEPSEFEFGVSEGSGFGFPASSEKVIDARDFSTRAIIVEIGAGIAAFTGVTLTIREGSAVGPIIVSTLIEPPPDNALLTGLPAGTRLVWDGHYREVIFYDAAGDPQNGLPYLTLPGLLPDLIVPAGQSYHVKLERTTVPPDGSYWTVTSRNRDT